MLKAAFNIAAIGITLGTAFSTVVHGGTWAAGLGELWKLFVKGMTGTLAMGERALTSTLA